MDERQHAYMCWVSRAGNEHCPKNCDCWCHEGVPVLQQAHPDPRRGLTGLEKSHLNEVMRLVRRAHEVMETGDMIHESFRAGVTATYERMLDAVMYGYPAAIFDGWNEETAHDNVQGDDADAARSGQRGGSEGGRGEFVRSLRDAGRRAGRRIMGGDAAREGRGRS